jgi:hypothetical protein
VKLRGLGGIRIGLAILVTIVNGHEVNNLHAAPVRSEGGLQDVGVLQVDLARVCVRSAGLDAEPAADVFVEDGREDAG